VWLWPPQTHTQPPPPMFSPAVGCSSAVRKLLPVQLPVAPAHPSSQSAAVPVLLLPARLTAAVSHCRTEAPAGGEGLGGGGEEGAGGQVWGVCFLVGRARGLAISRG
jgi:hypothetical protein